MKLTKITKTGTKSSITTSDSIFGAKINKNLLSQAVRIYLSNLRQGTSKALTRGEVTRTKKKWYRQKGTGNARHGARSANLFVGGGKAHGPKGNENWSLKLTQKLKQQALISALSMQAKNIIVSDELSNLAGKTKQANILLFKTLKLNNKNKILIILSENKLEILRSLRNLKNILIKNYKLTNALDIASADQIVLDSQAVKLLEKRLS